MLTGRENLEFFGRLRGLDRAAAAIETLLARTLAGGEPTPADLRPP